MESLGRYWWLLALRGVVGILFGFLFFLWPLPSLATLVLLFGVWAFFDGCAAFASALGGRGGVYSVVEGIFGVGIAVLTFWRPMIIALTLYGVIAAWAIVLGIFKIVSAVKLRHVITNELWLGLERRRLRDLRRPHGGAPGGRRAGARLVHRSVRDRRGSDAPRALAAPAPRGERCRADAHAVTPGGAP